METKANQMKMDRIMRLLKFDHSYLVDSHNRGKSIALFWMEECGWEVVFSSK